MSHSLCLTSVRTELGGTHHSAGCARRPRLQEPDLKTWILVIPNKDNWIPLSKIIGLRHSLQKHDVP